MRLRILLAASAVAGAIAVAAAPASAATCFGAAARDAAHPCTNPTLTITPAIKDVDNPSESRCSYKVERSLPVCTFGTPKSKAKGAIVLLGDSHSWHLRAAVEVVAKANRWLGYSVTAPGCSYSPFVQHLPAQLHGTCKLWYSRARAWLKRHREVKTVFLSQLNTVYGPPGVTYMPQRVAGFKSAWKGMPSTVKHVVVVRDVPDPTDDTLACVARVVAAHTEPAGPACATPRNVALTEDAGARAVQELGSKRYQLVDLTQFFCDDVNCFPVIGGALVYRDVLGHITVAFSRSLGPFLLSDVRALMASW